MSWKSAAATTAWGVGLLTFLGSFGYAIYSVETGTGPGGWLIDLQLQWRGSYGLKLSILVTWVIVALAMTPLWIGLAALVARIGPEPQPAVAQVPAAGTAAQAQMPLGLWGGSVLVVVAAIVGGGGYGVLHLLHQRDDGQPLEAVSLAAGPAAAPPSSRFLAIEGVAQPKLIYGIGKKGEYSSKDFYLPLTAPGWKKADPVRYVLVIKDRRGTVSANELRGPFYVAAKVGHVPKFVTSAYEKEGVTLDRATYLVELVTVSNGKVVAGNDGEMAFLIGGGLLGGLGLVMAMVSFMRQRIGRWRSRPGAHPGMSH